MFFAGAKIRQIFETTKHILKKLSLYSSVTLGVLGSIPTPVGRY